jgi:hypothetical protein
LDRLRRMNETRTVTVESRDEAAPPAMTCSFACD